MAFSYEFRVPPGLIIGRKLGVRLSCGAFQQLAEASALEAPAATSHGSSMSFSDCQGSSRKT